MVTGADLQTVGTTETPVTDMHADDQVALLGTDEPQHAPPDEFDDT